MKPVSSACRRIWPITARFHTTIAICSQCGSGGRNQERRQHDEPEQGAAAHERSQGLPYAAGAGEGDQQRRAQSTDHGQFEQGIGQGGREGHGQAIDTQAQHRIERGGERQQCRRRRQILGRETEHAQAPERFQQGDQGSTHGARRSTVGVAWAAREAAARNSRGRRVLGLPRGGARAVTASARNLRGCA